MAFTIADLIEHSVDLVPDRTAVVSADTGREITFAQLEDRANRLAHFLSDRGVGPGDKVAIYSRNNIESVEIVLAVFKLRAVSVNVNYRYVGNELVYLFDNSDSVAVFFERRYSALVEQSMAECSQLNTAVVIEDGTDSPTDSFGAVAYEDASSQGSPERDFGPRSNDDLFMVYTGGTTGMPKGVVWRQEDVWRVLGGGINFMTGERVADEHDLARVGAENPAMTRYPIPPMIHGATFWAAMQSLFTGGRVVLSADFDPVRAWEIIAEYKVNVVLLVGDAMARPMIDAHDERVDTSVLYAVASSAALFSPSVKEQYLDRFPNTMFTDSIGSSETGFAGMGIVAKGSADDGGPRVKIDAANCVLDDNDQPIVAGSSVVGRLARRGHIPLGYYKDEAKTRSAFIERDGVRYAIPGDYARVESDGTVTMLGRGSVSINTGGEKVFPEEVEGALKAYPGVMDCLVVGVDDEVYGQRVAAVVQPRPGAEVDLQELVTMAREHIAGYKVPRSMWIVERIERSPSGKPDYRWAREITDTTAARAHLARTAARSTTGN
ncbi:MAG: acyl-CoA synthetase [Rhodococcus sp. (in: high G+C Gram-positive bacteria)]